MWGNDVGGGSASLLLTPAPCVCLVMVMMVMVLGSAHSHCCRMSRWPRDPCTVGMQLGHACDAPCIYVCVCVSSQRSFSAIKQGAAAPHLSGLTHNSDCRWRPCKAGFHLRLPNVSTAREAWLIICGVEQSCVKAELAPVSVHGACCWSATPLSSCEGVLHRVCTHAQPQKV